MGTQFLLTAILTSSNSDISVLGSRGIESVYVRTYCIPNQAQGHVHSPTNNESNTMLAALLKILKDAKKYHSFAC